MVPIADFSPENKLLYLSKISFKFLRDLGGKCLSFPSSIEKSVGSEAEMVETESSETGSTSAKRVPVRNFRA